MTAARGEQNAETEDRGNADDDVSMSAQADSGQIPVELLQIPEDYFTPATEQGIIEQLEYQTYESMSYEDQTMQLDKTLPYD